MKYNPLKKQIAKSLVVSCLFTSALTAQTILIDIGDIPTVSPDTNGNHWTNITDGFSSDPIDLIDITGALTAIDVVVPSGLGGNNNGTMSPDTVALGDLGIVTATQDSFFTDTSGSLVFSNLDTNSLYTFTIFASRDTTDFRTTLYEAVGASTLSDTLTTSGANIGGSGINTNIADTAVITSLAPDINGEIVLNFSEEPGTNFAYLGAIKLDVASIPEPVTSSAIIGLGSLAVILCYRRRSKRS